MFYKVVKKPKVGQTIFMVGNTKNDSDEIKTYIKQFFVKKVTTTVLTDTPMDLVMGEELFNAERQQFFQSPIMIKKMKNHIIIETRCGEMIDLTIGERVCENHHSEPLGEIFFNRRQANRFYKLLQKQCFYIYDEAQSLFSTSLLTYFRNSRASQPIEIKS